MPSQLSEPAPSLAFVQKAHNTTDASLFLITGPSGSGKTIWCENAVDFARALSWPVSGLLSPAVFDEGRKVAIDLFDLRTGERRRLAERIELSAGHTGEDLLADPVTGSWRFDPATIAWGNGVLARAAADGLVIIDELGPLEFEQGQGLQRWLQLVDAGRYRVACVTVRPSLLDAARARWPHAQVVTVGDASDD